MQADCTARPIEVWLYAHKLDSEGSRKLFDTFDELVDHLDIARAGRPASVKGVETADGTIHDVDDKNGPMIGQPKKDAGVGRVKENMRPGRLAWLDIDHVLADYIEALKKVALPRFSCAFWETHRSCESDRHCRIVFELSGEPEGEDGYAATGDAILAALNTLVRRDAPGVKIPALKDVSWKLLTQAQYTVPMGREALRFHGAPFQPLPAPEKPAEPRRPVEAPRIPRSAHAGGQDPYAEGALDIAESELAAMGKDSGRNHQLFVSARQMAKFAAANRLSEADVRACVANGLVREDGMEQCKKTFNSGWKKGLAEPRYDSLPGEDNRRREVVAACDDHTAPPPCEDIAPEFEPWPGGDASLNEPPPDQWQDDDGFPRPSSEAGEVVQSDAAPSTPTAQKAPVQAAPVVVAGRQQGAKKCKDVQPVPLAHRLDAIAKEIQDAPPPISTGLRELDVLLDGGLPHYGLFVVGGGPGSGKTALALNMAVEAAQAGHPALVFSAELASSELVARLLCILAEGRLGHREALSRIKDGTDGLPGWKELEALSMNLYLQDMDDPVVEDIADTVQAFVRQWPPRPDSRPVVFVDYLQLIRARDPVDRREENRNRDAVTRLSYVARELKKLSKLCPVVVISSLNREGYSKDKRPGMEAFKACGDIEFSADWGAILREDPASGEQQGRRVRDSLLTVVKARRWSLGEARLQYEGASYRFSDPALGARTEATTGSVVRSSAKAKAEATPEQLAAKERLLAEYKARRGQ